MRSGMNLDQKKAVAELAEIKLRGLNDLFFFARNILGYRKMVERVHLPLCRFMQKEIPHSPGEQTTKIVLMPRGSFKSTVGTISYVLWRICRDPETTILLSNERLEKSKEFLKEIKGHITGNKNFRALFGDLSCNRGFGKSWSESRIDVATRKRVGSAPNIEISSTTSSVTGKHTDLIICDDLVGFSNYGTPDQLAKVDEYVKDLGAVLKPGGEIIFIGTRWDFRDVYNSQLEFVKQMGDLARADVYIRKAINDDGTLLFPEELSEQFLKAQRIKLGAYFFSCTPAETPILMHDWSFKPISDVRVGDKVMGFKVGTNGTKHHLEVADVVEVNSRNADIYEYSMESGRRARCTLDHQWYTGRSGAGSHRAYKPMREGELMCYVTDVEYEPTAEEIADYRYLAGIIDGEGACGYGSVFIHQSWDHNPEVCREIRAVLDRLGIPYADKGDYVYLTGGARVKERIVRFGKPAKADQILNTMRSSAWVVREKDRVCSIDYLRNDRVYALTTSTGNYIAWGYASKNCQYLNEPVNRENALIQRIEKYGDVINGIPANEYFRESCAHFMTVDLAYTDTARSDSTAIFVSAVDKMNGKRYVRDFRLFKTTDPEKVIQTIFEMHDKYKPVRVGIEANQYKSWLKIPLEQAMRRAGRYMNIDPPDGLKHYGKSQSKHLRMAKLAPVYNCGDYLLAEWMTDLEDQLRLLTYDGVRGKDDLLDAHAMQEEIIFYGHNHPANTFDNEDVAKKGLTWGELKRRATQMEEEKLQTAWLYS